MGNLVAPTTVFQGVYHPMIGAFYDGCDHHFAGQGGMVRNGTAHEMVPKSLAFIFGESVVGPLVDGCWEVASRVDSSFSKFVQWPLGVRADEPDETEVCSVACSPLPGDDKDAPEKICQETCKKSGVVTKVKEWSLNKLGQVVEMTPGIADCIQKCKVVSAITTLGEFIPVVGGAVKAGGTLAYWTCVSVCLGYKSRNAVCND